MKGIHGSLKNFVSTAKPVHGAAQILMQRSRDVDLQHWYQPRPGAQPVLSVMRMAFRRARYLRMYARVAAA